MVNTVVKEAGSVRKLNADEESRMEVLRTRAVNSYPYLSYVIFKLKMYATEMYMDGERTPTMGVDGAGRLFIDPVIFDKWTVGEQTGVLIHEINHVLRDHSNRMRRFFGDHKSTTAETHRLWNIVADAEINDDIQEQFPRTDSRDQFRVQLPDKVVLPSSLGLPDGLTAEQYATAIINQQKKSNPKQGKSDKSQQGGSGDSGVSGSGSDSSPGDGDDGNGDGSGNPLDGVPGHGAGMCSASHAQEPGAPSLPSGAEAMGGYTQAEMDAMREIVAKDIIAAEERGRGSVPGSMVEMAKFALKPPVTDWRKLFRAMIKGAMTASVKMDYSYRRVNRRGENSDVIPGLVGYRPKVHVFLDTSGSMSIQKDLLYAVSEIEGLAKKQGIRGNDLKVSCIDAHAYGSRRYTGPDSIKIIGRGGTDMRLAFTEVEKMRRRDRPDMMVVISDGGTPWPDTNNLPDIRQVVLITEKGMEAGVPNWISTVVIDRD